MDNSRAAMTFHEIMKFNPFHDRLGRFANKMGFSTYSANPKMKVAQPSIIRSAKYGHGRTMNIHRESKGENIEENYLWLHGHSKPTPVPRPRNTPTNKPTKQKTNQSNKTQDKNISQGKATNAVDGKDLTGKFKFNDNSTDYSIEQVIKAQGFDGKPTITSDPKVFASACRASNFAAVRGVGASDKATMKKYDDDFKYGEFYVKCSGGRVHGYGLYAASFEANSAYASSASSHAQSTARAYASGKAKKIYSMTLDKSAKIGIENDIYYQMKKDKEYIQMCNNSSLSSRYTMDVGVYAVYKGYDAFVADGGRSSRGNHSDYTVILNRSKVILYDDAA